jgi:MYXO-CTERM domain-containing protein
MPSSSSSTSSPSSTTRWLLAAIAAGTALAAAPARAQVGSGWVPYDPPSTIHLDGSAGIETYPGTSTDLRNEGATFTNQGGIETFALFNNISNRSERRMQNTYLDGSRQFEGEVRVSPPTDDESVQQVFGGNSGATTQMIRAYNVNGGTLRKVPGSVVLAENIHGVWIKVNVIHDVGGNFVRTYINGRLLATGDGEATNAGNDGWYHKYGCYGTLRTPTAKVEWRNVKHFRDGSPPPGNGPGPGPADAGGGNTGGADGGGAEAGGPQVDGGGSGGAGGSSGSGGASGQGGGSAGAGGGGAAGGGGGSAGAGGGAGGNETGGGGGAGASAGGATGRGGGPGAGGSGSGRGGAGAATGGASAGPSGGDDPGGGCACRAGGPGGSPAWAAALGIALALVARRRRR